MVEAWQPAAALAAAGLLFCGALAWPAAMPRGRAARHAGLAMSARGLAGAALLALAGLAVYTLAAAPQWLPRWPFAWRYDPDLPVSPYVWRKLGWAAACGVAGAALVVAGLRRGRRGWPVAAAGLALAAAAPWPSPALFLVPAQPASFLRSPLPYSPATLRQGADLYATRCAGCHGATADGRGPRAASLPRWPGTLGPALFRDRLEGEIHAAIVRHAGMQPALAPPQAWQVLDYLRALAYGVDGGAGMPAVPAPDIPMTCRGRGALVLSALRGLPVRVVAHGPASAADERDDPRLITVALTHGAASQAECIAPSGAAWDAYALVAGVVPGALAGAQFLVDRQGWLRARHQPGSAPAWTSSDSVCGPSGRLHVALAVQGLDPILKAMDATPVGIVPRPGAP